MNTRDEEVFQAIVKGARFFREIPYSNYEDARKVDKALQRLRKTGRIQYLGQTQGWRVMGVIPATVVPAVTSVSTELGAVD